MCSLPTKKILSTAHVNVHLILKHEGKILFLLRKNTGYADGHWCLVSGHVEENEAASNAIIREACEESGVVLSPADLRIVHVAHTRSNRLNIDIFFECENWQGLFENREPEKCETLALFALNSLPEKMVPFLADVLKKIFLGEIYSEHGWEQ